MEWIRILKKKFFSSPEYKEEMKALSNMPVAAGVIEKLYDGTFGIDEKDLPSDREKKLKKAVVCDIFLIVKDALAGGKKDFVLPVEHKFSINIAFSNLMLIHYTEKLKEEGYTLDTNDVCLRIVEKLVKLAPDPNPARYYVEGQDMLRKILDNIHQEKVGGYVLGIKEVTNSYLGNFKAKNPQIKKQCRELFSSLLLSMHKGHFAAL